MDPSLFAPKEWVREQHERVSRKVMAISEVVDDHQNRLTLLDGYKDKGGGRVNELAEDVIQMKQEVTELKLKLYGLCAAASTIGAGVGAGISKLLGL